MDVTGLLAAWMLVYAINLAPAFMPPTWSVLAFVGLALGLPPLPLAVGGAFAATAGRFSLATLSRRYGTRLLSAGRRRELESLGLWLEGRAGWAAPVAVLVYSFGPIPSNQLFVAAGLMRIGLGRIVGAFLAGRLISYPLWIGATHVATSAIGELFERQVTSVVAVAVNLLLIALVVLFTRVDWIRVIRRVDPVFALRLRPNPPT